MIRKTDTPPKCKMCDNSTKWNSNYKRFGIYCSSKCSASDPDKKKKQLTTVMNRYGVANPLQNQLCREKTKQTNLEKYGSEYYNNPEKIKQTNLEKYGTEYPFGSDAIQATIKQTNLEKYGVTNPQQNQLCREKTKQTNLEKYGVDNPLKNEFIRHKIKQTNLDRYGVEWFTVSTRFKELITNKLNQYGVHHLSHIGRVEVFDKIMRYDWLFDQYITQNKTAMQIANELKIDDTTIGNYLKKHEIAIKYNYGYSYKCICWLEQIMKQEGIYIQHALNEGEYLIPGTRFKADGFCVETNTIYEFHGDLFHGNPVIYNPDELCHPFDENITAGELHRKTIERENLIKSMGYELVVMWEHDY